VLRVTADTNILISGLNFRGGKPFQLLELAREGKINLTVSEAILDETADVLARKLLRCYPYFEGGGFACDLSGTGERALAHDRRGDGVDDHVPPPKIFTPFSITCGEELPAQALPLA
jgi:hypothetical protein